MNTDIRLFRKSTLLSLHEDDPTWAEVIDGLEVIETQAGPDDRFQLIPAGAGIPLMLPSCSYWNRSVDEPWFIFTPGEDIDGGTIYIGQTDFHALAQTAGYIPASLAENVKTENMRLKHELTMVAGLVADLRGAIASLVGTQGVFPDPTEKISEPVNTNRPADRGSKTESRAADTNTNELSFSDLLGGSED